MTLFGCVACRFTLCRLVKVEKVSLNGIKHARFIKVIPITDSAKIVYVFMTSGKYFN